MNHQSDLFKDSTSRKRRIEEMRRQKQRQIQYRKLMKVLLPIVFCLACIILVFSIKNYRNKANKAEQISQIQKSGQTIIQNTSAMTISPNMQIASENQGEGSLEEPLEQKQVFYAENAENMIELGGDIISTHAVLIDVNNHKIIASKLAKDQINPASMTKILTLLVAAEHVDNLDDTFTITKEITDYSYSNDCSAVGFLDNETVSVRDLLYGTILPSGGDAAAGLAEYVAGSREQFVEMLNDKLADMGLADTAHFTNCVGLYDESHVCTPYDMAMILEAALQNNLAKEVLSTHTYTTSQTAQHPEGITVSNWFLRRIEDKDCGGTVIGAKTGYVVQSGNCAASYAEDADGNGYICVTAGATSAWRCIYDHVAIYQKFLEK